MRRIYGTPVFLPERQRVAQPVLDLERDYVLHRNDSIRINNASILATRQMRAHYELFNCCPPDRELSPLLPWPMPDG
jgi:hypothetical protein